jgi:Peptidase family M28
MAAAWRALLVVALLLAGLALKGVLTAPPAAHAGEFDTNRAIARLQRILGDQRPHPVDSPADDAVRGRLIAELRGIGLSARVQDTMDCSAMPKTRFVSCSHVRNVIATIPSQRPGPQLLLNAHYDSTPTGPGAGDDGLGVAVLLEVGSILKAAPTPRPVTLLFNEGEEFGLNGAHAFVRADPLASHVNSLINIDVRGVSGPALMYETSDPNGAAVSIYVGAAHRPYANSISTDFAKLIPNTTDVVYFKPRGWTLLNYGIIGNETRYHSPGDTLAALDRNSFAHVGTEVLAATRTIAAAPDVARAGSGRIVFSDLAGRVFFRLHLLAAAIVLVTLLLLSILLAWREKALGKPLAVAAAVSVGGMLVSGFAGFVLGVLRAGDFWRAYPLIAYLALYAVLLLAMAAIYARLGRGIDRGRLRAASWLLILVVGSILSIALPGATIFFLIAPAVALLGIAASARSPRFGTAFVIAAVVIQFLMFAELLALVEMLLIDGPLWAVVPLAALSSLPAIVEVKADALRPSIILLALCSLGLSTGALAVPRASSERPLGFSIDYFRDVQKNTADWAIATKQAPLPANYPGKWDTGVLPYNGRTRWIMTAPLLRTPVASVRIVANEPSGAGRRLRLLLSAGGGNIVSIRFPKDARVLALGLAGAALPIPAKGEPEKPLLRCTGRSCEGLRIEVLLGDRKPVVAELFSTRFGLPPEGQPLVAARPRNAIPQYAPDQTITRSLVRL